MANGNGPSVTRMMTDKLKSARGLFSAMASLMLVLIVFIILPVLMLRLFGVPTPFMNVPTSELAGYGIFLFCAGYVLSRT